MLVKQKWDKSLLLKKDQTEEAEDSQWGFKLDTNTNSRGVISALVNDITGRARVIYYKLLQEHTIFNRMEASVKRLQ